MSGTEKRKVVVPRSILAMSRTEVLAELHRQNPFGGYDRPRQWAKVTTEALRISLARWRSGR